MLAEIKLKGFKSFYDGVVSLNGLTVLTGLNSSGKSSVIQVIRMLDRVKRKHTHLLPGYGIYRDLRNDDWNGDVRIEAIGQQGEVSTVDITESGHSGKVAETYPHLLYISAHRLGPQVNIPVYANDTEPDEYGNNVLKSIREHADDIVSPTLKKEGWIGNTLSMVLKEWMKIISPSVDFDYKIVEEADLSYSLFNGHRAKNVGFGLSYTLPVITALLLGTVVENSIVIIENPEAHLHAKAQTEIADLIARCVEAGAQVIVETHSDHLFDGLRIYVKEHPGFEKKMNCYWFELDEDKNTEATLIELNCKGRIVNLTIPPHFMDQFEYNSQRLLVGR